MNYPDDQSSFLDHSLEINNQLIDSGNLHGTHDLNLDSPQYDTFDTNYESPYQDTWQQEIGIASVSHDLNWQSCQEYNQPPEKSSSVSEPSHSPYSFNHADSQTHFGSEDYVSLEDDNYIYKKDDFIESADGTYYKNYSDYSSGTNGYEEA